MYKYIVFILISSLFIAPCLALAQNPVPPMAFYGVATINGEDIPIGTIIKAYDNAGQRIDIEQSRKALTVTTAGLYGTDNIADPTPAEIRLIVAGAGTISFRAIIIGYNNDQEITANETATFAVGMTERKDLTFTATATSAPQVCAITTVANGVVGAYPECAITCNSGYTLSGNSCVVTTAPPSSPSSSPSSPPSDPSNDPADDTDDTSTLINTKDLTDDGKIDFDDFATFALLYGKSYTGVEEKIQGVSISWADYDKDGKIDFTDFAEFALSYGK